MIVLLLFDVSTTVNTAAVVTVLHHLSAVGKEEADYFGY